ncbi:MAG: hypothetical protein AAF533_14730 [Acidobacteriota bacterium]
MKYRHRGYQDDDDRGEKGRERDRPPREHRDPDLPGGRLSEKQRVLRQLRCHHCGELLPLSLDSRGDPLPIRPSETCSKCDAAVHSCRNCTHFDPDAAFECRRKVVKQSWSKAAGNDCEEFEPKVTAEMTRDENKQEARIIPGLGSTPASDGTSKGGRQAFDDLFK